MKNAVGASDLSRDLEALDLLGSNSWAEFSLRFYFTKVRSLSITRLEADAPLIPMRLLSQT